MKYQFSYNPLANINTELIIFDDSSSEVIKFERMQEVAGEGNMFTINSFDFNTTNVFLMARVIDPIERSRLEFNFIYE